MVNNYGSIHYADIFSKFLTNCIDILENEEIVKQLANGYVRNYFRPPEDYDAYINAYVIEISNAPIGDLFCLESLSSCTFATCVYNCLKITIKSKYKPILDHELHAHHSLYFEQDVLRIRNVSDAMIFLQVQMSLPMVLPYEQVCSSSTRTSMT